MCKKLSLLLAALGLSFTFVSCTPGERGALVGGAIGAGTGALIGDSTGALVGGAVGAVVGSEISKNRAHRNYGYSDYDDRGNQNQSHQRGRGSGYPPPSHGNNRPGYGY